MALELAKVEGEVNTFKGEERYAFSLELNAFDLFETEAALALERSNNGALIPDELWFYVKSSPGMYLFRLFQWDSLTAEVPVLRILPQR